jgi:hypothetical protein
MLIVANGQLANSSTAIWTGTDPSAQFNLSCLNTSGASTETVLVTITPSGGSTARRVARAVLLPNEQLFVMGFAVGNGDVVKAQATDATTVDYILSTTTGVSFSDSYCLDSTGAIKNTGASGSQSVAGTMTVTSTSANALAVGPSGASNPTFNVDASTSSAVTGVDIVGAASGAGVTLKAISSNNNEPLLLQAKGSGVVNIASVSTGQVYLSRGALSVEVVGRTETNLGTTQSSSPTIAQLLTGLVIQSGTTGAGTVTVPTGTAVSAGMPLTPATGDTFTTVFCSVTGGQTLTLTGQTGTTMRGTVAVAAGKNATMTFTNTGANTWDIFTVVSA